MSDRAAIAIVLAAGKGTRMKSGLPKVLHALAGMPMVGHVLELAKRTGIAEAMLVVAPGMDSVVTAARKVDVGVRACVQHEQLGTAHAVLSERDTLDGFDGDVLVLYGDTPLLRPETIAAVRERLADGADVVVLGFEAADPTGYGRLVLDGDGRLAAIREDRDASPEERRITLCNSGVMGFRGAHALALLEAIGNDNAKGEYYLTDAVERANATGLTAAAVTCPEAEVMGVNSRAQLAGAEAVLQDRLRRAAMDEGATLVAPETVFLSADTVLGRDVIVEPNVVFGPGVRVDDGATIKAFSHLEGAHVGAGATIGPYARLRPGSEIGPNAKVGNFVEIKKAVVEEGAKVNHLTYIGDARVGAGANIGAGTITCNYDGFDKHHTDIGAGAFIGSNSSLVAPVSIGDGAYIGSGSVIAKDVGKDALALTRAPQEERAEWAAKVRARRERTPKAHHDHDKGEGA